MPDLHHHVEIRILDLIEEKERLSHRLNAIDNSLEIYKAKLFALSAVNFKTPLVKPTVNRIPEKTKPEETESKPEETEVQVETLDDKMSKELTGKRRRGRPPSKKKKVEDSKSYKAPASPHKLQNLSTEAAGKKVDVAVAKDEKAVNDPGKAMRAERRAVADSDDDGNEVMADLLGMVEPEVRNTVAPEVETVIEAPNKPAMEPKTKKDIAALIREISQKGDKYRKALSENIKDIIGVDSFSQIPSENEQVATEIWHSLNEWSKTL